MELTIETIELIADGCIALDRCDTINMAKQLLAEMDKPKVWDNAPENATIAKVHFYKRDKVHARPDGTPEVYTRELPKSPEREIAEKKAEKYLEYYGGQFDDAKERLVNDIESAINEYKEWEAER